MTDADRLVMLKVDLGISTSAYDNRLTQYLQSARMAIEEESGVFPPEPTVLDDELIVMYAAWKWRKRSTGEGMPRMLRYALNNRMIQKKAGGEDG